MGTAIACTGLPTPGNGGRSAPQVASGASPPAAGSGPGAASGLVPVPVDNSLATSLHGSAMVRRTGRAPLIASWHNPTRDDPW
jgi:hypothetical protein